MKKNTFLVLVFCFLFTFSCEVFATEQREGWTTGTNINVREKPSTKSKAIVILKEKYHPLLADEETIAGDDRKWYRVELFLVNGKIPKNNIFGYIASDYVELKPLSETTYINLPDEIWGLKIGSNKSDIKDLITEEDRHNKGNYNHYVERNIQLTPKLKLEKVLCYFDEKDKLVGFEVRYSDDEKIIQEMYNYVMDTYGESKDRGGDDYDGGDGMYFFWTDKDKGLSLQLSYYDYEHLDYMVNLSVGLIEKEE